MATRIFTNVAAQTYSSPASSAATSNTVLNFHKSLPTYDGPTPLIPLSALTRSSSLKNVFLKDERFRFGDLPSFEPLGIAWAIRNGIIAELSEESSTPVPQDIPLSELAEKAKEGNIKLVVASDGNLGFIVARLRKLFGVEGINTRIFIPEDVEGAVKERVRSEGAEVIEVPGDFEVAMREASLHAVAVDGVFIDYDEVENYEDIPRWIVEGYSTIFREVDEQLGRTPDLVVVPVGNGGLAQAAVTHYRAMSTSRTKVLAVESGASGTLFDSLKQGKLVSEKTKDDGTVPKISNHETMAEKAWEVLKEGLDASIIVKNEEVRDAIESLEKGGVAAGSSGGAVLAGLRKVVEDEGILELSKDSVVVLISTDSGKK